MISFLEAPLDLSFDLSLALFLFFLPACFLFLPLVLRGGGSLEDSSSDSESSDSESCAVELLHDARAALFVRGYTLQRYLTSISTLYTVKLGCSFLSSQVA